MKKLILLAALVLMSVNSNAFDLKSLFGGKSSTTTTTTQSTGTVVSGTTATAAKEIDTDGAKNYGSHAGTALKGLYDSYIANGKKINAKDITTYANLLSLVANCECLKDNYKDLTYMGSYGLGLVEGSLGLVTEENQNVVTNALVDVANNTIGSDKVSAAANTASALTSLFAAFK